MANFDEQSPQFLAPVRCGGVTGLNEPMPSREELLARNSFGSPDDNPYLTTPEYRKARAQKQKWGKKK